MVGIKIMNISNEKLSEAILAFYKKNKQEERISELRTRFSELSKKEIKNLESQVQDLYETFFDYAVSALPLNEVESIAEKKHSFLTSEAILFLFNQAKQAAIHEGYLSQPDSTAN
jgi:hypothetical protein